MPKFSSFLSKLAKNTAGKRSNLLYQRLEEAVYQGVTVWIETSGDAFGGIPIYLDHEFVEILALSTTDEYESYSRTSWLIRLSSILAIAYPTEHWSKDRLESLLVKEEKTSRKEE